MTRSFRDLLGEPGPRRNVKIALAALALFDLVFYLFAIGPLAESDRERRQEVENLKRLVHDRIVQVHKLDATVHKVETARSEGDKLLQNITLPRRTASSTVMSELDQAAKKAGVELRDRGFGTVEEIEGSDTLGMMTVNQILEGNYENLVRFLNLLDRSPRFLIVESLGAAPQQSGPQQKNPGLLSVTLKLDAFVTFAGES